MSAVRAVSASRRSLLVTAAAFGLCLAFLTLARADGFLIPEPTPIGTGDAFSVTYHHVTVTVDGQIAKTEIDQVFRNETSRQLEADYLFPIPVGAQVSEFIMYDGKNRLTGELLDREQAVRVYEEIVRQRRDPGLLEYVGRDTIRARVFPLPPGGEKRFQVSYLQMVPRDGDLCKYLYPLSTERFSARPLADLTINVTLRSAAPIQAVYSPSHDIVVERQSDRLVTVKFEAGQVKPTTDFALYYTLSPEKLALSAFRRPSGVILNEEECLLAQGVLCLGPATRAGCEAVCVKGNMPCTGCFGPTSRVKDQGAKALSAIAATVASNDAAEIERILSAIPDPIGTLYRYSLPASLLRRKRAVRPATVPAQG